MFGNAVMEAINQKISAVRDAALTAITASDAKAQAANDALERLLKESLITATTLAEARHESAEHAISKVEAIAASVRSDSLAATTAMDAKAQAANDAMQRLIEANMNTTTLLASSRFDSIKTTLSHFEDVEKTSRATAVEAADAVDKRSAMRHETASALVKSAEQRISDRIASLQAVIDLRAEMNQTAITKAEQANERRFEAVNEFRETLTEQANQFVTRANLDVRVEQLLAQLSALSTQTNSINSRLDRSEGGKSTMASNQATVIGIIAVLVSLVVGGYSILSTRAILPQPQPTPPPPQVIYQPRTEYQTELPYLSRPPAATTIPTVPAPSR